MQRATALRLLGGAFVTASLAACQGSDCSIPIPLAKGSAAQTQFGLQIYPEDDINRALALVAGCGGSMVRIGLYEGGLAFTDAVFAAAAQRGMRVVLLTQFVKQPVDIATFASDNAALQQRYAQYDPVWEIWNEPNLAFYWGAQPNVLDYSRLAIETGKALRAAGARDVWSGGTSGIDFNWIIELRKQGVFDVMNGCAVHSYEDPCSAYGHYQLLVQMVPSGVQIHTTETCLSSEFEQADFLRRMWYIHRNLALPTMVWCELRDGTAGTKGIFAFPYGLVDKNYNPKPSYKIAQQVIL
jgi:hypothetical protein